MTLYEQWEAHCKEVGHTLLADAETAQERRKAAAYSMTTEQRAIYCTKCNWKARTKEDYNG